MIEWALMGARQKGCAALKLDCAARPALTALYERMGFARADSGPMRLGPSLVMRYARQA